MKFIKIEIAYDVEGRADDNDICDGILSALDQVDLNEDKGNGEFFTTLICSNEFEPTVEVVDFTIEVCSNGFCEHCGDLGDEPHIVINVGGIHKCQYCHGINIPKQIMNKYKIMEKEAIISYHETRLKELKGD